MTRVWLEQRPPAALDRSATPAHTPLPGGDVSRQLQETMRALRVVETGAAPRLEVRQLPVPSPGPGQVLVRMHAAPMQAADLALCRGSWGLHRPLPTTPGVEGMGEVVSSGGGIIGRWLVGRRVALLARPDGDGTWAEYVATDASLCMPLGPHMSDRQGATLLFNPLTALAALDLTQASPGSGLLVTGASGALGRMIVRLGRREGLNIVALARRPSSIDALRAEGAAEVLVQDDPELDARLRRATRAWRVLTALDVIGGHLTGRLVAAMPDGAEVVALSHLGAQPTTLDPLELVFHRKRLRGFWLHDHLADQGARHMIRAFPRLVRHSDQLHTVISGETGLAGVSDALAPEGALTSEGKILITLR